MKHSKNAIDKNPLGFAEVSDPFRHSNQISRFIGFAIRRVLNHLFAKGDFLVVRTASKYFYGLIKSLSKKEPLEPADIRCSTNGKQEKCSLS